MSGLLLFEQALNGLQFGLMLFLLAAGLTIVFGVMDMINLAHGSLYLSLIHISYPPPAPTSNICWRRRW